MGPDTIVPVVVMIAIMLVPITAILTSHQRKMAMIIHQPGGNPGDVARLQAEILALKQALQDQTLALDSLSENVRRMSLPQSGGAGDIRERLGGPQA